MTVRTPERRDLSPIRRTVVAMAVLVLAAGLPFFGGSFSHPAHAADAVEKVVSPPPGFGVTGGVCSPHGCCKCTRKNRKCCPVSCEAPGRAQQAARFIYNRFLTKLLSLPAGLEAYEKDQTDITMVAMLTRLNQVELDLIEWWKTLWWYNFRPALQDSVDQTATAAAEQARNLASAADASELNMTVWQMKDSEKQDHLMLGASENVCVAANSAGGLGRVAAFSKAMRLAWQNEALEQGHRTSQGYRRKSDIHPADRAAFYKYFAKTYEDRFCNPDDNAGRNVCGGATEPFYNADTQVTKYIYDTLTIPVDKDPAYADAVTHLIINMTGDTATDPVSLSVMKSPQGQGHFLARRSFLARKAAVRSLPQLSAGWRMPGSRMGDQVTALRQAAGVPFSEISQNPSYRELMHAISIDRFNSGQYAAGLISDQNKIEMEKLTLDSFYLMQLRDYYELLERTALTLAVQVSILAETAPPPNTIGIKPLQ